MTVRDILIETCDKTGVLSETVHFVKYECKRQLSAGTKTLAVGKKLSHLKSKPSANGSDDLFVNSFYIKKVVAAGSINEHMQIIINMVSDAVVSETNHN